MSVSLQPDDGAIDGQLVDALRDGETSAAAFLVSRHAPRLLGYAAAIASDIPETDRELLCERVVETAATKIDAFDTTKGTFPGWLRGILRNEVKSWRRRSPGAVELDEGTTPAPPRSDRSSDAAEPEPSSLLAPLLQQLTPTDRLMIQLRDLENLPYALIAQTLDVREDACRQRHRRALERLTALAASLPTSTSLGGMEP